MLKINFADQEFILDSSGAAYWPGQGLLIIADAHLEKGSSFAKKGYALPPYDSEMTLRKIEEVTQKYEPERIIILGDFFHDNKAFIRLSGEAAALFENLKKKPIVWITGNHDLEYKPENIDVYADYEVCGIVFRHEAMQGEINEISGHYHPKNKFTYKGEVFYERCFIEDGKKLILPAFGAYTGGLLRTDKALWRLLDKNVRAYIIINDKVFREP